MAKTGKPTAGIDPSTIDEDAQYRVELSDRIDVEGTMLCPGWDILLRGDVVKRFAAAIARAEKLDADPV